MGSSGSGKSVVRLLVALAHERDTRQVCHNLAVHAALQGDVSVLFIDSGTEFMPARMAAVANAACGGDEERRNALVNSG
jgi:hypothetical protein